MTDSEILEAAAKAAGAYSVIAGRMGVLVQWTPNVRGYAQWNPRDDDGDSRRLQVMLDMETGRAGMVMWARRKWPDGTSSNGMAYLVSPAAGMEELLSAARLAVLRCAASVADREAQPG